MAETASLLALLSLAIWFCLCSLRGGFWRADHSHDGTRAVAEALAAGAGGRLTVTGTAPLPGGWTGTLWALEEGVPLAGLLYSLMTVDSAVRHWRGRGGHWKGRVYPARARLDGWEVRAE